MTMQQLEYFCVIAEEGSIGAASRVLHTTQPPISRQLALLENELGVQLFTRHTKGMKLTYAGQHFYQEIRRLRQGLNNLLADMKNIDDGVMGVLNIGVEYSVAPYGLPLIAQFREKYPLVELAIHVDAPKQLEEQIKDGSLNLAFTRIGDSGLKDFSSSLISEDPLELFMIRKLDPAPDLSEIPVELLKGVPFCLLRTADDWNYANYLSDLCQRHGFLPNIVCRCGSSHIAIQMVLAGLGIIYLPRSIIQTVPNSGIYTKPVAGTNQVSSSILMWNENVYMPPCGRLFKEMCLHSKA